MKPFLKKTVSNAVTEAPEEKKIEKFYTWNQSATELNLSVCILEHTSLNKSDLQVTLRTDSIEITHCGKTILSDSFSACIKADESTWTLSPTSNRIDFMLEKAVMGIWSCCLKDMHEYGEYKEEMREDGDSAMDSIENKK